MTSQPRRGCKGCRPDHHVTEEVVQRLLSDSPVPLERRVSARVYAERLRECGACPRLHADGFTCALCGCIVRVMALDRARACPQAGGSRWDRQAS